MTGWFSPAELAALNLPGLPSSKFRVLDRAKREAWAERRSADGKALARRRRARGGGTEYHYSLLPAQAVSTLVRQGLIQDVAFQADAVSPSPEWSRFDALPQSVRDEADRRLAALKRVEALRRTGLTKVTAVARIAAEEDCSPSTVHNWFALCNGRKRADWLPALAPRHAGANRRAEVPQEALDYLKSDYLRPSRPSLKSCLLRLQAVADEKGWALPSEKTLARRIEDIPEAVRVLARDGEEALERMYPAMERDRSHFHALEAVNADGHKWDVFVRWEDGTIGRPLMLAVQDLYSSKIVGWRVDRSENADLVRLTFGDVFRDYGVPDHVWLDNGRGFASKWITGGTSTRFRFKVKAEDPAGVLTALGCQVHWTRPYRGQSKPIERAFRDLCDHVAKHPAFAGAYTGNRPDAKPEDYGRRAVPIEEFLKIAAQGIAAHNARPGRRTKVCRGIDSFDQAFARSYAEAPVRKASPVQLRMCLLAAEKVTADRRNGAIRLLGNRYWSEALSELRGEKFVARFDPERLDQPLEVYRLDGSYVGPADVLEMAGFDSVSAGRAHERKRRAWMKAQKELAEAERRLSPQEVADLLPEIDEPDFKPSGVVRLVHTRGNAAAAAKAAPDFQEDEEEDFEAALTRGLNRLRVVD